MRITSLKLESVKDLLIAELRDLHNAEEQLVEALPKMAEAASSTELKNAFNHHLEETRKHVTRLDEVFERLAEKANSETCEAMKGLVKEGEEFIKAKGQPDVRDAGLIGAAQRVEHYEMAGYGTARTLAKRLGLNDIADTLQKTLEEERAADQKLTSRGGKRCESLSDEGGSKIEPKLPRDLLRVNEAAKLGKPIFAPHEPAEG